MNLPSTVTVSGPSIVSLEVLGLVELADPNYHANLLGRTDEELRLFCRFSQRLCVLVSERYCVDPNGYQCQRGAPWARVEFQVPLAQVERPSWAICYAPQNRVARSWAG
jgi:hypothetical protein